MVVALDSSKSLRLTLRTRIYLTRRAYLGGGVDRGLLVQQEAHHVDLAKVSGGVEGSVARLGVGVRGALGR